MEPQPGSLDAALRAAVESCGEVTLHAELFDVTENDAGAGAVAAWLGNDDLTLADVITVDIALPDGCGRRSGDIDTDGTRVPPTSGAPSKPAEMRGVTIVGTLDVTPPDHRVLVTATTLAPTATNPIHDLIAQGFAKAATYQPAPLGRWPLRVAYFDWNTSPAHDHFIDELDAAIDVDVIAVDQPTVSLDELAAVVHTVDAERYDLFVLATRGESIRRRFVFDDATLVASLAECGVPVVLVAAGTGRRRAIGRVATVVPSVGAAAQLANEMLAGTRAELQTLEDNAQLEADAIGHHLEQVATTLARRRARLVSRSRAARRRAGRQEIAFVAGLTLTAGALALRFGTVGLAPMCLIPAMWLFNWFRRRAQRGSVAGCQDEFNLWSVVARGGEIGDGVQELTDIQALRTVVTDFHRLQDELRETIEMLKRCADSPIEIEPVGRIDADVRYRRAVDQFGERAPTVEGRARQLSGVRTDASSLLAWLSPERDRRWRFVNHAAPDPNDATLGRDETGHDTPADGLEPPAPNSRTAVPAAISTTGPIDAPAAPVFAAPTVSAIASRERIVRATGSATVAHTDGDHEHPAVVSDGGGLPPPLGATLRSNTDVHEGPAMEPEQSEPTMLVGSGATDDGAQTG